MFLRSEILEDVDDEPGSSSASPCGTLNEGDVYDMGGRAQNVGHRADPAEIHQLAANEWGTIGSAPGATDRRALRDREHIRPRRLRSLEHPRRHHRARHRDPLRTRDVLNAQKASELHRVANADYPTLALRAESLSRDIEPEAPPRRDSTVHTRSRRQLAELIRKDSPSYSRRFANGTLGWQGKPTRSRPWKRQRRFPRRGLRAQSQSPERKNSRVPNRGNRADPGMTPSRIGSRREGEIRLGWAPGLRLGRGEKAFRWFRQAKPL